MVAPDEVFDALFVTDRDSGIIKSEYSEERANSEDIDSCSTKAIKSAGK